MWRSVAGLLLFALAPVLAMGAEPLATAENPQTRLEIFAEPAAAGGAVTIALRFTPAPGWHTYWKNFGDSGKEPGFYWTLPEGWSASEALFPLPHRIPVGPLMNYGYEAPHSLLVMLSPGPDSTKDGTQAVELMAEWLVCEDICIPESAHLSFTLPDDGEEPDPATATLFADARAALPRPSPFPVTASISDTAFRIQLGMAADERDMVEGAWFYPLTDGVIGYAAPQQLARDSAGLSLLIARPGYAPPIAAVSGVVVIDSPSGRQEGFAVEAPVLFNTDLRPGPDRDAGVPTLAIWQAVLFALLGGVILNLMPCVFPVLSLKAFGLMKAHADGEAAARRDGAAYTAGVLTSFLAIAVLFVLMRSAGQSVGWGFQLQMPLVVAILALLLFAVGLNLAGLYEIGAGAISGIGQGLAARKGVAGSFFTGVLATIVATPCTAPFMAPALGFAALQPDAVAVAIFLALGLGLALPYLAVAFIPAARHALPRPGVWMITFRKFLAWPMFLTALWLLWILGLQAGVEAVIVTIGAMMLFAFLFWPYPAFRSMGPLGKTLGVLIALGLFAGLYVVAGNVYQTRSTVGTSISASHNEALDAELWSPERVATLRAEGRPVFVYFTAAWCITCKVNERVALADAEVAATAKAANVAILEADWTNPDQRIADALARHGRNGVPLYLYYAPGASEAEVLPQVLLPDMLISRFAALAGATAARLEQERLP